MTAALAAGRTRRHPRARRLGVALAAAWAVVALAGSLYGNLMAGLGPPFSTALVSGRMVVRVASPEARSVGIEPGHRLVGINGIPAFEWTRRAGWREFELERPDVYALETKDGQRYEVRLEPHPTDASMLLATPLFLAGLLVGLAYLGLGLAVWRLRAGREASWAFALFCSAMAAQLFTAFGTFRAPLGYERAVVNFSFLGAAMFHLFTIYPFEPGWVRRRPWLRRIPWAFAAGTVPLLVLGSAVPLPSGLLLSASFFSSIALGFACVVLLMVERYRHRGDESADRADVMLLGALLSFVPVLVLLIVELFWTTGFPIYLALLWFVIFPISVAWGIVRNQLFDIRYLARSSVAYGGATLAITGLYALLIASADYLVKQFDVNARSPQFSLVFLFFAILAFNPLLARTQRVVDRLFDRDQGRYREAVREISEAMVSMLSVREVVERIVRALTDAMGVERSMVILLSEDERSLRPEALGGSWPEATADFELGMEHPICKYLWMRREEVSRSELETEPDAAIREACLEVFDELGVALLVPILYGVDMLGVIAVGRKLSGERFHADDRQLLLTLANQSSIAIENARAFDEIAQLNETLEARVEERTRELQAAQAQLLQSEKMRSLGQLVAGVAHELNNPIGFVHANLKLLEEYVARLDAERERGGDPSRVRDAVAKLLARSREGTERVKKIVQDLRTFSRMDQSELQDADLNQEIERTVALMEPRCRCGIEIERDYGELPPVRCHAGQLNQVFLNLLMNACDALGEKGRIRIRTRAQRGGVRLDFEDDGPGIAPEVRDRIFEPFFTTKPVGQGTGLGLSLSHGIIERHGGRIRLESEPGCGARFVIELPLDAVPRGATSDGA